MNWRYKNFITQKISPFGQKKKLEEYNKFINNISSSSSFGKKRSYRKKRRLKNRRSKRDFNGVPPKPDELNALLEAFRWAPSGSNKQPWRVIVTQSEESNNAFDECLNEGNRQWAAEAPTKMIILGNPEEQPERNGLQRWLIDVGMALQNLLLQGSALELTVHAMAGWDEEKILEKFKIPAPYRVVALFAVGYPGNFEDLPPEVQEKDKKPSTRKSLSEFVFYDNFENVWNS